MQIARDVCLQRLISRMNNGMIKVITGIRRCGKTYLLFTLFYEHLVRSGVSPEDIITVSLEDMDRIELRDPMKLYGFLQERTADPKRHYYVFIDEAQLAISRDEMRDHDTHVRLYGVLNGLLRTGRADVYITGSNSRFLSSDVLTEFRGRGDEFRLAPLAFSEFLHVYDGSRADAWRDFSCYGGMPLVLTEKEPEAKIRYLERLCSEIYLRDIRERYGIRSGSGMEELMKSLASSVGSLTNPLRISRTFGSHGQKPVSLPTVASYIEYLRECFLVQRAERFDIRGRRYVGTPSKYYFCDPGIRNAVLSFRQYEETRLMENIIFNELVFRGYTVDVGVVETRGNNGSRRMLEVDFVVNRGPERYYIQSAYAVPDREKLEQETASLLRIGDSFRKIVVVNTDTPVWKTEQGITVMGLYDFLLHEDSLNF